jgi:multiple sugar transport system substrate-binding protein
MSRNLAIGIGVLILLMALGAYVFMSQPPAQISTTSSATTTKPPTTTATSTSTQPTATTPQLSGSLTVLVPTGDPTLMPYVRMVSDEFTERYPGVKITIQPVPFGRMVQTALTALQNKNPDPTVIIFYPSQAPTLGPYLKDLTPTSTAGF